MNGGARQLWIVSLVLRAVLVLLQVLRCVGRR